MHIFNIQNYRITRRLNILLPHWHDTFTAGRQKKKYHQPIHQFTHTFTRSIMRIGGLKNRGVPKPKKTGTKNLSVKGLILRGNFRFFGLFFGRKNFFFWLEDRHTPRRRTWERISSALSVCVCWSDIWVKGNVVEFEKLFHEKVMFRGYRGGESC